MIKKGFLLFVLTSLITISYGQKVTKSKIKPYKIGILYNLGNEKNFIFKDDPDYYYKSRALKGQLFYKIAAYKGILIDLIVQPQIHFSEHQLINEQFVTPDEPNYLEKRARFTKRKNLSITAVEFTVDLKKELFKKTVAFLRIGLGLGYIDTATERLAKGFTFLENANIGLTFQMNSIVQLQVSSGLGHISNFNFQLPNSGYNVYNLSVGFTYLLK